MQHPSIIFESKLATYPHQPTQLGTLNTNCLLWQERGIQQRLDLDDVVGTSLVEDGDKNRCCLLISAYPQSSLKKFSSKNRELREYHFVCEDSSTRLQWQRAIDNALGGTTDSEPKRRQLQILINPNSGRKKALEIFARVRPLFDRANLEYTVTKTTSATDTKNLALNLELAQTDGLVIVGGDGTLHDAIAGLMSRPDRDAARLLPLGVIPGGTGNGLCKSLLTAAGENYTPLNAAFIIAKGRQTNFDLAAVTQNNKRYHSFLSLAWGLVSDIDIESEAIKFFGAYRFDIYALLLIGYFCYVSIEADLAIYPTPIRIRANKIGRQLKMTLFFSGR